MKQFTTIKVMSCTIDSNKGYANVGILQQFYVREFSGKSVNLHNFIYFLNNKIQ